MSKRIYTVSDGDRTEVLVRASSRSQAISHVARKIFRSRVATQGDLELHLGNGAKIEETGEQADEDGQS